MAAQRGARRRLQLRRAPAAGRTARGHGPGPRPAGGLRTAPATPNGRGPSAPGCRPSAGGAEAVDSTGDSSPVVTELLERSHRLGSDPRNTNYAGGNTSCKGSRQ